MGSDSDFPVLEPCVAMLRKFGVEVGAMVCDAHRTPEKAAEFARNAERTATRSSSPPPARPLTCPACLQPSRCCPSSAFRFFPPRSTDSTKLLSIVQMPAGIPVATVAINGSENAALLAVQIMGAHPVLRERMRAYKAEMAEAVEAKDRKLQEKLKGIKV